MSHSSRESKGERDESAGVNPRGTDGQLTRITSMPAEPGHHLLLRPSGTLAQDGARPDAAVCEAVLLMLVTRSQTCFLSLSAGSWIFCCLRY